MNTQDVVEYLFELALKQDVDTRETLAKMDEVFNQSLATARADADRLMEAGNKMARFISTWQDCLSGVQISEEDFNSSCGLSGWQKARAALESHKEGGEV